MHALCSVIFFCVRLRYFSRASPKLVLIILIQTLHLATIKVKLDCTRAVSYISRRATLFHFGINRDDDLNSSIIEALSFYRNAALLAPKCRLLFETISAIRDEYTYERSEVLQSVAFGPTDVHAHRRTVITHRIMQPRWNRRTYEARGQCLLLLMLLLLLLRPAGVKMPYVFPDLLDYID